MGKYYYKKAGEKNRKRKTVRLLSLLIIIIGIGIGGYVFFPLISWQIYFAPAFASADIAVPIPQNNLVSSSTIGSLISEASNSLTGVDYANAQNWFPNFKFQKAKPRIDTYTLSIPRINIKDAVVSATDYDLSKHLVNYGGTAIPPDKGNAVVFGHSTLPQLFDPKNYKTIFAKAYELKTGDELFTNVSGVIYKYRVYNITVVSPDNTSVLEQDYSDSFLTLITCTPPGTTWKRLIIRARLETI
ncbi:MAG: sortase [Patescibacteria group bacterium]|nr:sortase [Patescibacteria group bacterium]